MSYECIIVPQCSVAGKGEDIVINAWNLSVKDLLKINFGCNDQ